LDRKDLRIVTICKSGHRSAIAMMAMQLLGFKDVKSLAGGLNAWNAAAK
jgi:rhodanese-related sulfurtransferase